MKKKSARKAHKSVRKSVRVVHRKSSMNTGMVVTILLIGFVILAFIVSR